MIVIARRLLHTCHDNDVTKLSSVHINIAEDIDRFLVPVLEHPERRLVFRQPEARVASYEDAFALLSERTPVIFERMDVSVRDAVGSVSEECSEPIRANCSENRWMGARIFDLKLHTILGYGFRASSRASVNLGH